MFQILTILVPLFYFTITVGTIWTIVKFYNVLVGIRESLSDLVEVTKEKK